MLLVHLTLLVLIMIPAPFYMIFFSCADRYFFLFFFWPDDYNTWNGWLSLLEWIFVISSVVIVLFLPPMLFLVAGFFSRGFLDFCWSLGFFFYSWPWECGWKWVW